MAEDSQRTADTAAERLEEAEQEAAEMLRGVRAEADGILAEAAERARWIIEDARATADGVRSEGMELVSSLRSMSDLLRSGSERLLRDLQRLHEQMVSDLERVTPAGSPGGSKREPPTPSDAGEELDVPEFIRPP